MRLIITSGYYNPLHRGHLECLTLARALGDHLIVIVNSDAQVKIKGSRPFMNQDDRMAIVAALKPVDEVMLSIDEDGSQCRSIEAIHARFSKLWRWQASQYCEDSITFAKGGDRFASNVPEVAVCARLGVKIVDGLGGKIRSSSTLLADVAGQAI